jgi:hypothetical protein
LVVRTYLSPSPLGHLRSTTIMAVACTHIVVSLPGGSCGRRPKFSTFVGCPHSRPSSGCRLRPRPDEGLRVRVPIAFMPLFVDAARGHFSGPMRGRQNESRWSRIRVACRPEVHDSEGCRRRSTSGRRGADRLGARMGTFFTRSPGCGRKRGNRAGADRRATSAQLTGSPPALFIRWKVA